MEYNIDKNKASQYYEYLNEKYAEWCTHPLKKDRERIETEIRYIAENWDDTIYIWLNDGRASGLFEPGFFESDIQRCFSMLKEIVGMESNHQRNKLYQLYKKLQNFLPSPEDVVKKELRDYLIGKIHNGDLSKGKISFRDSEDFEYFSKLTSSVGVDADALLEEIVMKVF